MSDVRREPPLPAWKPTPDTLESGRWVTLGAGYAKRHACKLPGWFARRRASAGFGAVWECHECRQQWKCLYGGQWYSLDAARTRDNEDSHE